MLKSSHLVIIFRFWSLKNLTPSLYRIGPSTPYTKLLAERGTDTTTHLTFKREGRKKKKGCSSFEMLMLFSTKQTFFST